MSGSNRTIPEELWHDILIRVPVKTALTCKCVCKSWLSLISNPNFGKSHLQQNKNNISSSNRLLIGLWYNKNSLLQSIGYDSLESSSMSTKEIEDCAVSMQFPFRLDIHRLALFGCCDGLVFLWLYNGEFNFKGFLCVWNPATGEYKKIPQSRNSNKYIHKDICITGLGYDGKNDDYKCVIGVCSDKSGSSTLVEVFSLRWNSWETIQTPYKFICNGILVNGVLVNGVLHWLAEGEHGFRIVCFDSSSDMPSFKEIQLPKIPNLEFITVGVLEEGCLCVVADIEFPGGLNRVEVWEMQVYGVAESWTKRYVISNEAVTKAVMDRGSGLNIMWCYMNGNVVFLEASNLVLYDPKHKSAVERRLNRFAYSTSAVNYAESLISLNTGIYVGTERLEKSTD